MDSRPLGRAGEGLLQAAVFVPAPAGLFLPPTAAFFTVVSAGVMHRMTVEMAPMSRRKTCFPTSIGDIPTKAKPPSVTTAFCVYFSPSPTLPKGRELMQTASNTVGMVSRPLGEGRGGALGGLEWGLMWNSRPLGRVRRGAYTSCGNSVGVAIPQPRVTGEARYPGYPPHLLCNAVSVAFSRRRYSQCTFLKKVEWILH